MTAARPHNKYELHGLFVGQILGDRLVTRYTDGGPGKQRDKRKARAAKAARKRNRK